MKLLIVSNCVHYEYEGRLWSYGPYTREIDLWADLFSEVRIAGPVRHAKPAGDCVPFQRGNIAIQPMVEAGGETLTAKLGLLAAMPSMTLGLVRGMRWADVVHLRCPCNLAILGTMLAPLFAPRAIAKYAGSWMAMPGDEPTTHLQRWLLRNWFRGLVTVYGDWPGQPKHIIPFFTSLTSEAEMDRARRAVAQRKPSAALRLLYTGRLSSAKNVDCAIEAVARAAAAGAPVEFTVVGEGPERASLEKLAEAKGLRGKVHFTGGVDFETVLGHLEQSDAFVLTSQTEGWPKSAAEAMAFGLVCIGSNRGFFRQMLQGRGIAVEPRDVDALAAAIISLARNPEQYAPMRRAAAEWAWQFSMEGLRDAIRELLERKWSLKLAGPRLVGEPATAPIPAAAAASMHGRGENQWAK